MRPKHFWVDLLNSDLNGIFVDQQPNGAATLNGAEVSGGAAYVRETEFSRRGPGRGASGSIGDHADRFAAAKNFWGRSVLLESAGNWSGVNFTIVGIDQDGFTVSEVLAGPNATTVTGVTYFQRVDSITSDGTVATDIESGFSDVITSPTIPLDWRRDQGTRVVVNITGTINYDVHQTFDPIYDPVFMSNASGDLNLGGTNVTNYANIHWVDLQAGGTADSSNVSALGATAIRVQVNSYTDGAEIDVHIVPEMD